jgi:hypothetical protein
MENNQLLPRYDRNIQNNDELKIMATAQVVFDIIIFVLFFLYRINEVTNTWFGIINFIFICFFLIFSLFWLNYKLYSIFFSIYKLFFNFDKLHRNNKYYSGIEIPDSYVNSKLYPNITIQIPIYKENLNDIIKPTLYNCIRESNRYTVETNALCNIVVCDDGYNVISEEEKNERLQFYSEMKIEFTARPNPNKYPRNGRFKKASNLNFSLNYWSKQLSINRTYNYHDHNNYVLKKNELIELGAIFSEGIKYHEYIFLIDSDTRFPNHDINTNGCLKRLIKEMMFDGQDTLFIQCYTNPYMSTKFFSEKCIYYHTSNIFDSVLISTAINGIAPLIGHNVLLNGDALKNSAIIDDQNYIHYWAEDRISEDFNCMMRGSEKGYNGRFAYYAGNFSEGVSFSYMSEYFKISKFACGAAELLYNPITKWYSQGIMSNDLIKFLFYSNIEWYNKMFICTYLLNFVAIAVSHYTLVYNLFFCEMLYNTIPYPLLPINLLWESIFVWVIIGGFLRFLFGMRLHFNYKILLKQICREYLLLTSLYGGISAKFSIMFLVHLFNIKTVFGATIKNEEKITVTDWIKNTVGEVIIYTVYVACIIIKLLFYTDNYNFVIWYGIFPLLWMIFLFWFGPLYFDVYSKKINKKNDLTYNIEDQKFIDDNKYLLQLSNSTIFKKNKKIKQTLTSSDITLNKNSSDNLDVLFIEVMCDSDKTDILPVEESSRTVSHRACAVPLSSNLLEVFSEENSETKENLCHRACAIPIEVKCDFNNTNVLSEVKCDSNNTYVLSEVKCDFDKTDILSEVKCDSDKTDILSEIPIKHIIAEDKITLNKNSYNNLYNEYIEFFIKGPIKENNSYYLSNDI